MVTAILVLPRTLSVAKAARRLKQSPYWAVLVADETSALCGILTSHDLEETLLRSEGEEEQEGEEILAAIASSPVEKIEASEDLGKAIRVMGAHGYKQLPVVTAEHPTQVIGLLSRGDVFKTYSAVLLASQA